MSSFVQNIVKQIQHACTTGVQVTDVAVDIHKYNDIQGK